MTFTADKDILLKSLIIADSAISSKNSNTVLANTLFDVDISFLNIIGTDNDLTIISNVDIISDEAFSFTVNSKKLIQIVKELPKGEISINVDENYNVSVKSKANNVKGKYKLVGTDKGDFPNFQRFNNSESFEIEQLFFKNLLKNVSYAASTDVIKPSFNGVYFISEKKGFITAVASDSRRLSLCSKNIDENVMIKEGIIIPLKTVNEVFKILGTGKCNVIFKNNQCLFRIGNIEIISRVIDGQFPNFRQVIPVDYSKNVYVKKDKLNETLRRVMVFTKEPSHKIYISFSKDKMKIEAKTADLGECFEEIDIESNNDEIIAVGLNSQYLIDSIKEIESDSIHIGITGKMSPVCIKNENDENSISVIMPIQIKSNDSEN